MHSSYAPIAASIMPLGPMFYQSFTCFIAESRANYTYLDEIIPTTLDNTSLAFHLVKISSNWFTIYFLKLVFLYYI